MMTIEFNKHHYSDLWQRQEHYRKTLGRSSDSYNHYINMIGAVLATCDESKTKFPHTIHNKQELIKIIMLAQADAVRAKLDISSLKAPKAREGLFKNLFKRDKDGRDTKNKNN